MSIWKRLINLAGAAFGAPERDSGDPCSPDPDDADFAAAVVALAAKMAKADGRSTADETAAFRAAFPIAPEDRPLFERFFALAQETVHGYEAYARRIGRRYRARPCVLEDVLDVLFAVAKADGGVTAAEVEYLQRVADLFGFGPSEFERIAAPHMPGRAPDPLAVLGLDRTATPEDIRKAWARLVAENHPDTFIARGAPADFVRAAQDKTAAVNAAYAALRSRTSRSGKIDRSMAATT